MSVSDNTQPDPLSKSQRKRDMHALQDIGKALMDLTDAQLARMPVPEELMELIQAARLLRSNEAKRRQTQYIGKKMRDIDCAPLIKALRKI